MQKIAIIGAGISGLSAAHFLRDKYEVTIFERENCAGGLIKCMRVNGHLFHTCGGHVFNTKRQDVQEWFWSKFQREEEFTKTDRNAVVICNNNIKEAIPYPIENHMYLFNETIQKSFINDLLEIERNKNQIPSNFEEFLRGRFGETLYQMYFKPYNEKVWRKDLKSVPLSWLEGKLPMPTVEEMLYNNFNHIEEKSFVHSTFWYEKNNGSQHIIEKLTKDINIVLNADTKTIEYTGTGWTVCGQKFNKVIFCGNIKDLPSTVKGVNIHKYKDGIDSLDYHGTTAVFCEIDKNPYSWIYQPSNQHESHRIICTGNFADSNNHNLPHNRMTATIEFTDEISKEEILDNLMRIPFNPTYLTHKYNQFTYPIQDKNTRAMISNIKSDLAIKHFYLSGRFADWEYYNMDIAIGAAMDLCKKL